MAYWFNENPVISANRVTSPWSTRRVPQYVFGHQVDVHAPLARSTQGRAVIRFLGPSGYPKDDLTNYRQRVSTILDTIGAGLWDVRQQVEINTGVSAVGLDLMLSEKFFGKFPTSGVVSWMLPKVTIRFTNGREEVITFAPDWSLHGQKQERVKWAFNMSALLINGQLPATGLTIPINERFGLGNREWPEGMNDDGRIVKEMHVEPEPGLGITPVDHMTFYGPTWGEAYDINRATLSTVVVLGGGLISREEAIAAKQNRIPVFCIDPDILPEAHNLGKKNEMDSASTYLVKTHGFQAYDASGIVDGIRQKVLGIRRRPGTIKIPYPET